MKILVASDIHGSSSAIEKIIGQVEEHRVDALIVSGDITNFGPISFAIDFFKRIKVRTLAIPGNCDPLAIVTTLKELGINLHEEKVKMGNHLFIGWGGSNPTPFNTPFENSEDKIFSSLDNIMEEGAILVSHSPPRGHVDWIPGFGHAGSDAVKKIVDKYKPRLVICGHIHEGRGFEKGEVSYLNPGPARRGCTSLVDFNKELEVQLLS